MLDLLSHGSNGLKSLAQAHIGQTKDLAMEGILDSSRINAFFGDYYKNFEELYLNTEDGQEAGSKKRLLEDLDSLAQGHFLPNENLVELAEHSITQFTQSLSKAVEFESSISEIPSRVLDSIGLIKSFDGQYTQLKTKLHASSDSDVFYKTLYSNYNTEMNFVIKNYFIFFDIIQKAIRKLFKNSIDAELTALEKRLAAKNEKLAAKRAEILEILKAIQDLVAEARKNMDSSSTLFVTLATTIKDLNKEMRNFLTISFHELEVFIHEPIQLLYRFLGSLDKMFTEVSEHADIEHSFLSVIDDSEASMLDTLKADHTIKGLLDKKVEVDSKSHLVFTSEFDIQKYFSAYRNMHNEWMRDVGGFLKPDSLIKHSLPEKSKEDRPADKTIPAEVKHYLELSEEDTTMALTYKYETRMNRKNIPHNGVIFMMNDYFVFYSSSMAGTVNLTIPYDAVTDLQPKKNFIGQNNGVLIEVKNGSIEFYLNSNSKRDEFSGKLAELREVHKVGLTSAIRKEYTKRSYLLTFDEKEKKSGRDQLTEEQSEHLGMRLQFCMKKMRIGVFNCDNLVYTKQVPNANLHSLVSLWFGIKPYIYESQPQTNFMYHWRALNNCSSQEICTTGQLPDFIVKGDTDFDQFLPSSVHISTLTFFENSHQQKVKEKITLIFTHVDQLACIVSATSGQKLEYECLMLLRQGQPSETDGTPFDSSADAEPKADAVVIKMWRRRGLKPEANIKELYSEKFIEFMVEVGQQRAAAARGEESKFEAMT